MMFLMMSFLMRYRGVLLYFFFFSWDDISGGGDGWISIVL